MYESSFKSHYQNEHKSTNPFLKVLARQVCKILGLS